MLSNTDTRYFDVQALKETLAAGKTSPQAQRPTFSSPRGSRSPGGFSVKDGLDVPGSPASVVSIGSIGSEARYKKHVHDQHKAFTYSMGPALGLVRPLELLE